MKMAHKSIVVHQLTRRFDRLTAVDAISFEVERGEIFGFLGPNGAGKTTTISMLCTLLRPTSGEAWINGHSILKEPYQVRQSIGIVFQDPSLDDRLTAMENLRFHALLYNVPRKVFAERAQRLLEMVELTEFANTRVRSFSGGMRRRLEIARGLLHTPAVLFLDEPTLGLDPQTRRHVWNYVLSLREQEEVTVFLTTHYMEEAEVADRIAIIDHGRIVALDAPASLKATVGGDVVFFRTSDNELAAQRLKTNTGLQVRIVEDMVAVEVAHGDKAIPELIGILQNGHDRSLEVLSVNLRRPTLEDVFIKLTGRTMRDEEADTLERWRIVSRGRRG